MRGHGLSARNLSYRSNCVADYARFDLPAIAAFVVEQSGQIPHWIGHSLGGTSLAAALGGQYLGLILQRPWRCSAARSAAPTGR